MSAIATAQDTRSETSHRKLQTRAGETELTVLPLPRHPFSSQVIERDRPRESSVEEALLEMCLAAVSVLRVEDITNALWGARVSASTVTELNRNVDARIEARRKRPIQRLPSHGLWLDHVPDRGAPV